MAVPPAAGRLVRYARGERGVDDVVSVALGHDGDEQLSRTDRARVERRPVELDIGSDEAAADGLGDVG
jgi:hypothetical protein